MVLNDHVWSTGVYIVPLIFIVFGEGNHLKNRKVQLYFGLEYQKVQILLSNLKSSGHSALSHLIRELVIEAMRNRGWVE